jgi:hypothetical protein
MSYTSGVFAGLSQDALRANLTQAQAALHALSIGNKVASAEFAMGDGSRKVMYSQTTAPALRGYIAELQRMLGMTPVRRATGIRF